MKKISVIIPCYNVETLICRCLDSILHQTMGVEHLEIICVDDCSTDGTREVLREYERRFPQTMMMILLDKNGKQGRARNIGLEYANGEYITYVDADDCIAPQMLESLLRYAEDYGCGIVECQHRQFAKTIPEVEVQGTPLHIRMDQLRDKRWYLLNRAWKTAPWGRLYRREFLREHRILFPEETFMEDVYFSGQCMLYLQDYLLLPETYYFYFVNERGTMFGDRIQSCYMDTPRMQDMTTSLLQTHGWYDDCETEYAYLHFTKSFVEPVWRMLSGEVLFSYDNFRLLKKNLLNYFPDIADNRYVRESAGTEISMCRSLLAHDVTEEQLRYIIQG